MIAYDRDSEFSLIALSKLEEAGVPVLTSLVKYHQQLARVIGFEYAQDREREDDEKIQDLLCPNEEVELVISLWKEKIVRVRGLYQPHNFGTTSRNVSANWPEGSYRPPTWRSLYDVLRELSLEELIQQIEETLQNSGEHQTIYCIRFSMTVVFTSMCPLRIHTLPITNKSSCSSVEDPLAFDHCLSSRVAYIIMVYSGPR